MPGGNRVGGELVADVFERKFEAISEALGIGDGFREIAKERSHLAIALQVALSVLGEERARGIEVGVLADAGEDVEHFPAAGGGVLHAIRSDDRESMMPGEIA